MNNSDFIDVSKKLSSLCADDRVRVPSKKTIIDIVNDIRIALFPEYYPELGAINVPDILRELYLKLRCQISASLSFSKVSGIDADAAAEEIVRMLPTIKEKLLKDVTAIYEGDPAAVGPEEVILSYPGFFAISIA